MNKELILQTFRDYYGDDFYKLSKNKYRLTLPINFETNVYFTITEDRVEVTEQCDEWVGERSQRWNKLELTYEGELNRCECQTEAFPHTLESDKYTWINLAGKSDTRLLENFLSYWWCELT